MALTGRGPGFPQRLLLFFVVLFPISGLCKCSQVKKKFMSVAKKSAFLKTFVEFQGSESIPVPETVCFVQGFFPPLLSPTISAFFSYPLAAL